MQQSCTNGDAGVGYTAVCCLPDAGASSSNSSNSSNPSCMPAGESAGCAPNCDGGGEHCCGASPTCASKTAAQICFSPYTVLQSCTDFGGAYGGGYNATCCLPDAG